MTASHVPSGVASAGGAPAAASIPVRNHVHVPPSLRASSAAARGSPAAPPVQVPTPGRAMPHACAIAATIWPTGTG